MRWWPRTLFGRVALIVCGGLAVAHLLTLFIIVRERGEQGLSMMVAYVGRDVGASVAMLDHLPASERVAWLPRLARQNYWYTLAEGPVGQPADQVLAESVALVVAKELGPARVGPITQTASPLTTRATLHLPLRLADGMPLTLHLAPPPLKVSATTLALLLAQLSALALAAWLAVRLAVRPVARMAELAQHWDQAHARQDVVEQGPQEVLDAMRAFHAMRARIDNQLAERMQLLAAISHDLQSPITRMRLRTETLGDEVLRHKLQSDLDGMQSLVEEGLAYARTAQAEQEAVQMVDVHALIDGLVCDAQENGHAVQLAGHCDQPLPTRVRALRRVVTNLLDNAIKFGERVTVNLTVCDGLVVMDVCDQGPGLPPDELVAVMQPYYRVESSRNRDTGGTGLGLAIAQQLTLALSGQLTLSNRAEGGLQARLILPMAGPGRA